jgi:hypothetical protein
MVVVRLMNRFTAREITGRGWVCKGESGFGVRGSAALGVLPLAALAHPCAAEFGREDLFSWIPDPRSPIHDPRSTT